MWRVGHLGLLGLILLDHVFATESASSTVHNKVGTPPIIPTLPTTTASAVSDPSTSLPTATSTSLTSRSAIDPAQPTSTPIPGESTIISVSTSWIDGQPIVVTESSEIGVSESSTLASFTSTSPSESSPFSTPNNSGAEPVSAPTESATPVFSSESTILPTTSSVQSTTSSVPAIATPSAAVQQQKAGLSSGAKAGIGVGVGLGVPLLIALIAVPLWLRRRRRAGYEPGRSSPRLEKQAALSSSTPTLPAAGSNMGRSSAPVQQYPVAQNPSRHSLVQRDAPPPPSLIPPSQHSLFKSPAEQQQDEFRPSLDEGSLMPNSNNNTYHDAPSPLEGPEHEPVSPVSEISPINSRPPSMMGDYGDEHHER